MKQDAVAPQSPVHAMIIAPLALLLVPIPEIMPWQHGPPGVPLPKKRALRPCASVHC